MATRMKACTGTKGIWLIVDDSAKDRGWGVRELQRLGFKAEAMGTSMALERCKRDLPKALLLNMNDMERSGQDPDQFIAKIRRLSGRGRKRYVYLLAYCPEGLSLNGKCHDALFLGFDVLNRPGELEHRLEIKGFIEER